MIAAAAKKYAPAIPILSIAATVTAFFGPAIFPPPDKLIYGWDFWRGNFYYYHFVGDSLRRLSMPYWDPNAYSGIPMLAHPTSHIFYPFSFLMYVFPLSQGYSFLLAIHLLIAGFTMYRLMRRFTDRLAALISAAVVTLNGFLGVAVANGHPDIFLAFCWVPLFFDATTRFFERRQRTQFLLAVFACLMQILAGFYNLIVMYEFMMAGIYLIALFFRRGGWRSGWREAITQLAGFLSIGVFAAGLAAVALFPIFEYSFQTLRNGGMGYTYAAFGSYTFRMLQLLFNPYAFGNPFTNIPPYTGPPYYNIYVFTVGFVPGVLAAVYATVQVSRLIRKKTINRLLPFYAAAMVFFILMALGSNFPLHKMIYDAIPIYHFFRIPARHLIPVLFLFAMVSGSAAAILRHRAVQFMLLVITATQLITFNRNFVGLSDLPTKTSDRELISFLQANSSGYRIYPRYLSWEPGREILDVNSGSYFGISLLGAYNSLLLDRYYTLIDLLKEMPGSPSDEFPVEIPIINSRSPVLDILSAKYILMPNFRDDIGQDVPGKFRRIRQTGRYTLYENLTALPKYRLASEWKLFPDRKSLADALLSGNLRYINTVGVLSEDIAGLPNTGRDCRDNSNLGTVRVVSDSPNKVVLDVDSSCSAILATSEIAYPAWKARLDGKDAAQFTGNIALRNIIVPQGRHMIELFYWPSTLLWGAAVTAFFAILTVLFAKSDFFHVSTSKSGR